MLKTLKRLWPSHCLRWHSLESIGCLRVIWAAQSDFSKEHTGKGFATSLVELRPSFIDGQIDRALTSGTKNGYLFIIAPGIPDSSGHITKYTATATPETFEKTGFRSLFADESGIYSLHGRESPRICFRSTTTIELDPS